MNISLSAQTVTYEALNSGDWNNPATWVGGNIPPTSNSSNGVRILMQGADKNISLNWSIYIDNGNEYSFNLSSGTLSIYGDVEINGLCNLTTQGTGKIKIYGNLTLNDANITCSQLIEVFGDVNISGTGTVNVNGGPLIVHGNFTSSSQIQIIPDAVIAVAGSFEGHLASYNGENLYVGTPPYSAPTCSSTSWMSTKL